MEVMQRIEDTLEAAVASCESPEAPPLLAAAIRYAVFPGGARVRPRLCLAVAATCGDRSLQTACGAAAAIELLHCASLVHDDLPCFDAAATRRGKASVHCRFSEQIAVLTGDALIVLAFDTLARNAAGTGDAAAQLPALIATVAAAAGAPRGITAGQAWESEPAIELEQYEQAKTGSLFVAAVAAGAQAAGKDPAPWLALGARLGEAYQVADDIRDASASAEDIGKPVGCDVRLGRPSAVGELGLPGAVGRFDSLVAKAVAAIPRCDGAALIRHLIRTEAERLIPEEFFQRAA